MLGRYQVPEEVYGGVEYRISPAGLIFDVDALLLLRLVQLGTLQTERWNNQLQY